MQIPKSNRNQMKSHKLGENHIQKLMYCGIAMFFGHDTMEIPCFWTHTYVPKIKPRYFKNH